MIILNKAIRIIDYEKEAVYSRSVPDSFNEYIDELILHIENNESVRQFKTTSCDTEVINCILQIAKNKDDNDIFLGKVEVISRRLLQKEINAQKKVSKMDTNVQKGSLIQALLYDEENESFSYLLAKVEHSDFVDDADLSFKSGFSKNKKTYWKSCLFSLKELNEGTYYSKVYSNTVAKYWSVDFLELEETINDENNTLGAFTYIDKILNYNLKKQYPKDHTVIRNSVILYFKNNEHIDYNELVDSIFGKYNPVEVDMDKFNDIISKLKKVPGNKKFDFQFISVPSVINAKIKKVYEVNEGIQLKIIDGIEKLEEKIKTIRETDGKQYLIIETNNEDLFNRFKN